MLRIESGMEIIEAAAEQYQEHFNKEFPLYEYIEIAEIDGMITKEGAERFKKFIEERIEKDEEVDIPEDYYMRRY